MASERRHAGAHQDETTLISVLRWGPLLDGELFAMSRYVE